MMKILKLLAVDTFIVLANIIFFTNVPLNSFGAIIIIILLTMVSVVTHYFAYAKFYASNVEKENVTSDVIQSDDNKFSNYLDTLLKVEKEHPEFSKVIDSLVKQLKSFNEKEDALIRLIELNEGKSKTILMEKNDEVKRIIMIKNVKKFVKRLIAYGAVSEENRSRNIEDDVIIKNIFNTTTELIKLYDKLLDEVSRMGDDIDISDSGLQSIIDSLQSLRGADEEDEEDDDDTIHLFVSTGSRH